VSRLSRVYAWEHIIDMGHNDHGVVSAEHTADGFAPFDWETQSGGYTTIQHSSITPSTVSTTARAYGNPYSTFGFGGAESSFMLEFDIATPSTFRLEGTVSSRIGLGRVSLTGPGTNLLFDTAGLQPTPFLYEGILAPGRYQFEVFSSADYGSAVALLTVVPGPGAASLAAAAMFGWPRARRARV
jgi:hypothetical protein